MRLMPTRASSVTSFGACSWSFLLIRCQSGLAALRIHQAAFGSCRLRFGKPLALRPEERPESLDLDQPLLDGVEDGLGAVVYPELLVRVADVVPDRLLAYLQSV